MGHAVAKMDVRCRETVEEKRPVAKGDHRSVIVLTGI